MNGIEIIIIEKFIGKAFRDCNLINLFSKFDCSARETNCVYNNLMKCRNESEESEKDKSCGRGLDLNNATAVKSFTFVKIT